MPGDRGNRKRLARTGTRYFPSGHGIWLQGPECLPDEVIFYEKKGHDVKTISAGGPGLAGFALLGTTDRL
jgi:hypothetical protein